MNGKSRETIELTVALGEDGAPKTYYVAEVTEDGTIVKSNGKLTVTIDNPSPTATVEIVPETVITNDYDVTNTADSSTSIVWYVVLTSAWFCLVLLISAKKKTLRSKSN